MIRNNINLPYSLHDMSVDGLVLSGKLLTMTLETGINITTPPYGNVEGYVEFHDVDINFCHAYVFDTTGDIGIFTGEKIGLEDFILKYKPLSFNIIDEVYGYNKSHYKGFLMTDNGLKECALELYHIGDMLYKV